MGAEAVLQLTHGGARLLDRVVQDAGSDHLVRRAGPVQKLGHLERVLDERCAVGHAPLACVAFLGVG